MTASQSAARAAAGVERDGFALMEGVVDESDCVRWRTELADAAGGSGLRAAEGELYAARNVLRNWPTAVHVWRRPPLMELLTTLLGPEFGLVRGLFFDKPPGRSWTLPWHKDLTVAVERHPPALLEFRKPTTKDGVAHLEAPTELLMEMLTLRFHLDAQTLENGPLNVVPGTHRSGKILDLAHAPPTAVLGGVGSVLAMRPLLIHGSGRSSDDTPLHRRILHLEFAARRDLPDGVRWQAFHPVAIS
ncbi:MAG: phytanoyl-CoA dioxygenase family protein [Planctomycetia bacterium]